MTGLEIWLLAIGLAMDCFVVSIASGIILKRTRLKPMLIMAFFFGFFQALMPLLGWMGTGFFSHLIESIDHWIAFGILFFLGGRMIKESFKDETCKHEYDPTSLKVIVTLALATSIDALAVGISFALLNIKSFRTLLPSIGIIGFVSFALSMAGLMFGIRFGCGIARRLHAELWGGLILIAIGTKILIEHLFFT
ncbi:putative Mn2+ efflux pump MntP [Bacteroides zoogleoformans]|uniref:Putative manganese efflux pump MntP n=1 Tax=Bacteroides zoogleoformans TaxID=28119 RepID=A0ABM6T5I0_9BACE|nr:manganese efflux pump MntP family protein [Bacteroides zoogleoformans]AVM51914.1 manganese efflux pump [Bacteroides zoogleoformans]TWJ17017.1 putative Mn2+ efflux pump MntP [Bacteroides zoogleoformans]